MAEQELKLHVPRGARPGIERELLRLPVTRVRLRASYFDTPSRELALAGVALRLRLEGRKWVQTLKMRGEHALARIELNHARPSASLDLGIYAGTPAEAILASLKEPLGVCYETDVRRVLRVVRTRFGAVEIAYDTGTLRAGALELPISEIEFELVSGRLAAVFSLGRRWQKTHGLVVDARSTSERGDQLALLDQKLAATAGDDEAAAAARAKLVAGFWAPSGAVPLALDTGMTSAQALRAVTFECLEQIVRNSAVLSEVDTAGVCRAANSEHIHQLRVGVRRLRSAWSLFDGITDLPPAELRQEIRQHFSMLGGTRDDDVLREALLPVLTKAGLPQLEFGSDANEGDDGGQVAASREFQGWILDVMAWSLDAQPVVVSHRPIIIAAPVPVALTASLPDAAASRLESPAVPPPPPAPPALRQALRDRLHRWHRRILREGLKFSELGEEARHDLRKRVKRLRYGLQFAEALLPSARLKLYRKKLAVVQDILGEMNDLVVGFARFEEMRETQPSAWFACGWIRSRLETLGHQAADAFEELSQAKRFWD